MVKNQDLVNTIWLIGLVVFFFFLFRKQLTNIYLNLFRGNFGGKIKENPPVVLTEAEDKELSYRIGVMAGSMGGTMEDAAVAKYALLRSMMQGQRPTDQDIARAVTMTLSSSRSGFGDRREESRDSPPPSET
jgi:hypothetical protein